MQDIMVLDYYRTVIDYILLSIAVSNYYYYVILTINSYNNAFIAIAFRVSDQALYKFSTSYTI